MAAYVINMTNMINIISIDQHHQRPSAFHHIPCLLGSLSRNFCAEVAAQSQASQDFELD
jgi:hypothetical protein